jgi:hypothetical protein
MTDPTAGDTGPPGPPTTPTSGAPLVRWLRAGGWRAVGGAVAGAGLLATYSHFIGCRTGACLLTADVRTATVVGALIGLVMGWPGTARPSGPPEQQPR